MKATQLELNTCCECGEVKAIVWWDTCQACVDVGVGLNMLEVERIREVAKEIQREHAAFDEVVRKAR